MYLEDFQHFGKIPVNFIEQNHDIVLIKYCAKQLENVSLYSYQDEKYVVRSETQFKKGERSKERTILEVIQIVKQWRDLCEHKRGTSINLSQAAEIIGFPKKSLDDYYYQLRMGQKYGFDFHAHIYDRVGKLCSFLRNFKSHRKQQKNEKLPHTLKIVQEIGHYQIIKQRQMLSERMFSRKPNTMLNQDQNNYNKDIMSEDVNVDVFDREIGIQNQFYKEFNYNFGNQIDPFICLKYNDNSNQDKNFRQFQKIQEEKNNQNQFNIFD